MIGGEDNGFGFCAPEDAAGGLALPGGYRHNGTGRALNGCGQLIGKLTERAWLLLCFWHCCLLVCFCFLPETPLREASSFEAALMIKAYTDGAPGYIPLPLRL